MTKNNDIMGVINMNKIKKETATDVVERIAYTDSMISVVSSLLALIIASKSVGKAPTTVTAILTIVIAFAMSSVVSFFVNRWLLSKAIYKEEK